MSKSLPSTNLSIISTAIEKSPVVELSAGLEILEYLAAAKAPASFTAMAINLSASNATLYRVLNVLEERGYIARSVKDKTYRSTGRLLQLDVASVPAQRLLAHACPAMQDLCEDIGQSCNLSVQYASDIIVVGQAASPKPFCISVPTGFKYDLEGTAPGQVFAAFSQAVGASNKDIESLLSPATRGVVELGYALAESPFLPEVTDISSPIFLNNQIAGVLTIPYLTTTHAPSLESSIAELKKAAEHINNSLLNTTRVA